MDLILAAAAAFAHEGRDEVAGAQRGLADQAAQGGSAAVAAGRMGGSGGGTVAKITSAAVKFPGAARLATALLSLLTLSPPGRARAGQPASPTPAAALPAPVFATMLGTGASFPGHRFLPALPYGRRGRPVLPARAGIRRAAAAMPPGGLVLWQPDAPWTKRLQRAAARPARSSYRGSGTLPSRCWSSRAAGPAAPAWRAAALSHPRLHRLIPGGLPRPAA
jgi:hypothetical protein